MESSRNALIISDSVQLTEELKELLNKLDIPVVAANSDKEALNRFFALIPTFTFLDLDSETIRAQPLAKIVQDSEATKLSLIYKKHHNLKWLYGESEKVCFIKKPITLAKLNDIVNPHLRFANLLDEAKALLRRETGGH
ncbi:MAG: hypothetical protein MK198_02245 [Gracilimonas sp.]|uniref:hypothetical protein n=1 Tax=Gracilimonas sp. TaxID=1974203 RepID=UPI0037539593|nr:hypothetical protein [Gracilimonas sp.]